VHPYWGRLAQTTTGRNVGLMADPKCVVRYWLRALRGAGVDRSGCAVVEVDGSVWVVTRPVVAAGDTHAPGLAPRCAGSDTRTDDLRSRASIFDQREHVEVLFQQSANIRAARRAPSHRPCPLPSVWYRP
jgi:hypothetical protein